MSNRSMLPLIGILGVAVVGSTIAVATNAIRTSDEQYNFFDPIVDVSNLLNALYVDDPDFESYSTSRNLQPNGSN